MENGHPTNDELRRLMQFHLPVSQVQAVREHLRDCPACNKSYRDLSAGQKGAPPVPELNQKVRAGTIS